MSRMPNHVATTNACKLCTPLGACLAIRGIEGAVPLLHGSQGCATYMRRYIISHFNEPIDIASSSLGEKHAVFGGGPNLKLGLKNVIETYRPQVIGIATTCLTETIGDDVAMILSEFFRQTRASHMPAIFHVSTPSYAGTHMQGFHAAVRAAAQQLIPLANDPPPRKPALNLLPGLVSPADIRHLKEIVAAYGLAPTVLPDFSDTLDGPALEEYPRIPAGGTPLAAIAAMPHSQATIEFGWVHEETAGRFLAQEHGQKLIRTGLPIGIRQTDRFLAHLSEITGRPLPAWLAGERGRLIDSLADSHKYVSGKRAVIYGEEDLVIGLAGFLAEIGVQPVLCASGAKSGRFAAAIRQVTEGFAPKESEVCEDTDFFAIAHRARELAPDIIVGHSKGYRLARELDVPLIRVGFPIHDRMGGQRILHLGYRGAQQLFDTVTNALIARKQNLSPVGYSYM